MASFESALGVFLLAAAAGAAPPCAAPSVTQPIPVKYQVFHESDTIPAMGMPGPALPIYDAVEAHLITAEAIFATAQLNIDLVYAGNPVLTHMTVKQSELVHELIDDLTGGDVEERVEAFKAAATTEGTFTEGRLNIYYIDLADLAGAHLRKRSGESYNIIVMGLGFRAESLAHELGHAFSLSHVNFWSHDDPDAVEFPNGIQVEYCAEYDYFDNRCNFETSNVMWADRDARSSVTEGQAFRMACNRTSALIVNGDYLPKDPLDIGQPALPVDCPEHSIEGVCPEAH